MKQSRIFLILISFCIFGTYSILQNKIGQFYFNDDWEESWKKYIQKSQTTIIDKIQGNPFEIPGSSNPGFGTYIPKELDKQGGATDLFLLEKDKKKTHTEINYAKSVLINQVNRIYQKSKKFNVFSPDIYYEDVKGSLLIYTYLGPCQQCFQVYQKLSKLFPNLDFRIYYSYAYFESNMNLELTYSLNNLIKKYPTCKDEAIQMQKDLFIQKSQLPLEKFITNENRYKVNSINQVNDCIFEEKAKNAEKIYKNLKFKKIPLDEFTYKIEKSISLIKN